MRTFAARVALLALSLAALAPAVSRALGSAVPAWTEVCRSDGDGRAPAALPSLEHCSYCGTQAPPLALPPAGSTTALLRQFAHERPQGRTATAAAPSPWRLAAARAPPAVA